MAVGLQMMLLNEQGFSKLINETRTQVRLANAEQCRRQVMSNLRVGGWGKESLASESRVRQLHASEGVIRDAAQILQAMSDNYTTLSTAHLTGNVL